MPEGHRVNFLKESSAKLISKAVPRNPSVCCLLFVCVYPKLLVRSVSEPDVAEGSGLDHFDGYCVLQMTYISDFVKKAKRSVASSLCQNHLSLFMRQPEVLAKCGLYHFEDNRVL